MILALGAWGVVRLLDALLARPRGVEHFVAGLAYVLNPYVGDDQQPDDRLLTAYAALPWMLLAVHRGVAPAQLVVARGARADAGRERRRGNAATVAWVLVAPALLLLYEVR